MTQMQFSTSLRLAKALAMTCFMAASMGAGLAPAQAQDANKPAAQAGEGDSPSNNAWIKLCNEDQNLKKEVCVVTQELRDGNSGGLLASATVRLVEGEKVGMIVAVPVGMLLQPGIQVRVDKNEPKAGKYTVCFPNACVAAVDVGDEYIAQMKKGSEMIVATIRPDKKPIAFPLTLSGFTMAYEGPATDTKVYEESQQNLAEEIAKRAEEARKKATERQQQQGQPQQGQPKSE